MSVKKRVRLQRGRKLPEPVVHRHVHGFAFVPRDHGDAEKARALTRFSAWLLWGV